ncbi:ATP synthase gamma chain [Enhygromyxa salina]|uniref:ATP synthase gamma chain n=1 Tax=Enhygromyxa salina TaxID=215803 RepID=A0A0C2CRQ1_9BACT|nr:ATP synthase F1 subunit gamma [Enhygromyxa salina]KIG12310.1 ATP synthase gamma chain [Enhygromyxa salina]
MANLKEIRNRIGSVKSTRKITSAMSRIAAARLRRAQTAMENARQYGVRMASIVSEILAEIDDPGAMHPMLRGAVAPAAPSHLVMPGSDTKPGAIGFIVVTSERGLCGGFNSAVNRQVERDIKGLREQGREVHVITVGRKGRAYLKTYNQAALAHHAAPTKSEEVVDTAKQVALEAMALFEGTWELEDTDGDGVGDTMSTVKVDEVRLVFNYFRNVITQEVHSDKLLPVPIPEPAETSSGEGDDRPDSGRAAATHAIRAFEPDTKQLLDHLLPVAVETAIQQALYNSVAAEVAARRTAMDSATDNATELIGELTLQYNRERQAAITSELMEIIGGAEALKS